MARSFTNSANRVGDKLSPCRTPCRVSNHSVRSSLILTHDLVLEYMLFFRLKQSFQSVNDLHMQCFTNLKSLKLLKHCLSNKLITLQEKKLRLTYERDFTIRAYLPAVGFCMAV